MANVYDFDGTIYDGDSSVDFYLFCLKRHPRILKVMPRQLKGLTSYLAKRCEKTVAKQALYSYMTLIPDIEGEVDAFWLTHSDKVKDFYLQQQKPTDIIASASPEFLLAPLCHALGVTELIASQVDPHTGACLAQNCHDDEKVRLLRAKYPDVVVEDFYSDSDADLPLARIAQRAFKVRGERIEPFAL